MDCSDCYKYMNLGPVSILHFKADTAILSDGQLRRFALDLVNLSLKIILELSQIRSVQMVIQSDSNGRELAEFTLIGFQDQRNFLSV